MKRCKKCIIPDSFPNITFKNGICSFCVNHDTYPKIDKEVLGEKKLLETLTSKKNSKYDCVVPLSGGKDSSYVLYYITKKLNLNPLVVYFNNTFTTDIGNKNVESVCKDFEVDLVVGKANIFRKKLVSESFYMAKYTGRFDESVCGNCENNLRTFAINEALKRKIPFIVWGSTDFEDPAMTHFGSEYYSVRNFYGTFNCMLLSFLNPSFQILTANISFKNKIKAFYHFIKHKYYCTRDNIRMNAPEGWKIFFPFLQVSFKGKKVKTLYFFDYIKYNPYKHIKILEEETNWRTFRDKETRLDCELHYFGNLQYLKENGITSDGFYLAVLVRNGLLSRSEALTKEESVKKTLRDDCQKACKNIGFEIDL